MASEGTNVERGPKMNSPEMKNLVVTQPDKFEGLLDTIALLDKVSESMGGAHSGDWSGASGQTGGATGVTGQSARATAIANLPEPKVLREKIEHHIEKEIKTLRKEVRRAAWRAAKPGSAYKLNELYGKIRRLNSLLAELAEASIETLKRLFIRIFIDRQSVL